MKISRRVREIQPAIIQELMKYHTEQTISLSQGIPFFPPPEAAIRKVKTKLNNKNMHIYSPDAGLPELREAITQKLEKENHIRVNPEQVMVTSGANQAFFNSLLAIAEPDDEIILLRPYYFNHEMAVRMLGLVPVFVDVGKDFQPDIQKIQKAVTTRTKAIVTVSPNNPTGAVSSKKILKDINLLAGEYGIYHISDEPYEYFTFGTKTHYSPGKWGPEHTITLHSFSKAFGMAGWRVGYMCYPGELESELLKIQDTIVICPAVPSQLLALECMKFGKDYSRRFLPKMERSRNIMKNHLENLGNTIDFKATEGGYYFYVRVFSGKSSFGLSKMLIKNFSISVVPGETFGNTEGCYLRLSYGNSEPEVIDEGMGRFVDGIRKICEHCYIPD